MNQPKAENRTVGAATAADDRDPETAADGPISLSWYCVFCGCLRVFEGGRPTQFGHLDICPRCGSRLATAKDQAAVIAMVDQHLV